MFYKASLIFRMVDGWLVFFCIRPKKCFVKGLSNDSLRTVAKFVERDAHTGGFFWGFRWRLRGQSQKYVSTLRVQVEIICDCVWCSRSPSMLQLSIK